MLQIRSLRLKNSKADHTASSRQSQLGCQVSLPPKTTPCCTLLPGIAEPRSCPSVLVIPPPEFAPFVMDGPVRLFLIAFFSPVILPCKFWWKNQDLPGVPATHQWGGGGGA